MNDFYIDISYAEAMPVQHFGVFYHPVTPPSPHLCKKGEKMFSRFFYVIRGEIIFDKGTDDEIHAPAGSIVYLPNDISYRSEWLTHEDGLSISFNFILDETYFRLPDKICIAAVDTNGIYLDLFNNAYNIWQKGAIGYKLSTLSIFYQILGNMLIDLKKEELSIKHKSISRGIIYIENHYLEDFDVHSVAEMCNTSESSFRRLFKKYKKMSPVTYKNYLRIRKAQELLRTGEYTVTEVAAEVNISDICYFNKLFKRFTNTTPHKLIP